MAPPSSLVSRLKVQLKLSVSRLRMTQQKDTAIAKQQRRAMAQLLEQEKLESARIRVENIIRSDITTELHEILELYCELLLARIQLLDPPPGPTLVPSPRSKDEPTTPLDPGLEEAVRSLIYAAPRTEIKELHQSRALLVDKFGKDFALSAMEGTGVADRVLSKLKVETPPRALVDAYLREIARTYGVHFPGDPLQLSSDEDEDEDEDSDDEGRDGGMKHKALEAPLEAEELTHASPPRENVGGIGSPLRIAPPSPSTDNVAPKLKLPGSEDRKRRKSGEPKTKKEPKEGGGGGKKEEKDGGPPGGKIPDVDELARRFAALKR